MPKTTLPTEGAELFQAWNAYLRNLMVESEDGLEQAPPRIDEAILARAGYIKHFPHQVLSLGGGGRGLGESLTPAVCLHVYPGLQGKDISYYSTCITGQCTRFEGGQWEAPYRLKTFQMFECVVIGKAELVQEKRRRLTGLVESAFGSSDWTAACTTQRMPSSSDRMPAQS